MVAVGSGWRGIDPGSGTCPDHHCYHCHRAQGLPPAAQQPPAPHQTMPLRLPFRNPRNRGPSPGGYASWTSASPRSSTGPSRCPAAQERRASRSELPSTSCCHRHCCMVRRATRPDNVTLPHCHTVILPHTAALPHCHSATHRHTATPRRSRTVTLSYCRSATARVLMSSSLPPGAPAPHVRPAGWFGLPVGMSSACSSVPRATSPSAGRQKTFRVRV